MMVPQIHPQAICAAREIGGDVSIGAFSTVCEGTRLAESVTVGNGVMIGSDAVVGTGTSIGDGAILAPNMEIGLDCHIGPGVVFAFRRLGGGIVGSREPSTIVGSHCIIGANATICAGVRLGDHVIVDAGAVLTQNAHPHTIMAGNPAKVVGFSGTEAEKDAHPAERSGGGVRNSRVRGVKTYNLPFFSDPRGNLTVGEFGTLLPFRPQRFFLTFEVPGSHLRGEHAHKECEQLLVCIQGSCSLVVDDGVQREEFHLDRPTFGVFVPRMVWAIEYKHTRDSVLLVFASEHYDPEDYIREYDSFLELVARDYSK